MQFGLNFTPVYPADMAALATFAEEAGSQAATLIADLQRQRAEIGRPPLEIRLLTGWPQGYRAELVERYEAAGVDRLVVTPWTSSRAAREGIERFASDAGLV